MKIVDSSPSYASNCGYYFLKLKDRVTLGIHKQHNGDPRMYYDGVPSFNGPHIPFYKIERPFECLPDGLNIYLSYCEDCARKLGWIW